MQHNKDFLALVEEYRPYVKEVDINYVKQKLDKKDPFILIDVREDHEWDQGHIPSAIHISLGTIQRDIGEIIPNKIEPIVLYCGGGFRSVIAGYNIQKMGYTNVISMDGGIRDWLNSGYKLTL